MPESIDKILEEMAPRLRDELSGLGYPVHTPGSDDLLQEIRIRLWKALKSSNTTCILCGAPANRSPYGDGGWAYTCTGRCPLYSVAADLHYLLQFDIVFPVELKLRIADYLAGLCLNHGEHHELTRQDIYLATGYKVP